MYKNNDYIGKSQKQNKNNQIQNRSEGSGEKERKPKAARHHPDLC